MIVTKNLADHRFGVFVRSFCLILAGTLLNASCISVGAVAPETQTGPVSVGSVPALYADSRGDENYILVEKTFSGLSPESIPDNFRVTVSSADSTYGLSANDTSERMTDPDGNTVWRWKISGVGTGTYSVTESGEDVAGYTVTKYGEGTVEVKAADINVLVPVHETTCSHTNWRVGTDGDSNVLFAATLTQGGVAVISGSPLSASQRAAVSKAVLKINGPWKNPVYFYSVEEQIQSGTGFELNGATITYNAEKKEVIIGRTSNWQHVATLEYSVSEADDPEIALTNVYEKAVADVTVRKTVTGSMADREKPFDFTVSVNKDGEDASFTVDGVKHIGSAAFTVKDGESVLIGNVPVGSSLTVTEADYTGERYEASYTLDGADAVASNSVTVRSVTADGHHITFTNRKDVIPDTGVTVDTLPYVLILGTVAVCFTALVLRRRRIGR